LIEFFAGTDTREEAQELLEGMTDDANNWFGELFSTFTYEIIFYNANLRTCLYYAVTFTRSTAATLSCEKKITGFYPQNYDR
jgi:hypothetical protein